MLHHATVLRSRSDKMRILRAVSSAVEHSPHTGGATGSIPVPPTMKQALTRSRRPRYENSMKRMRAARPAIFPSNPSPPPCLLSRKSEFAEVDLGKDHGRHN